MTDYKEHVELLINCLKLKPHPEGGYYNENYRSKEKVGVSAHKYGDNFRYSSTSIYFLITAGNFSAWHKIKSDEIWNHHEGSALNILSINPDGILTRYKLGSKLSDSTAEYQVVISAGDWFCAYVDDQNGYSLAGCFVSPGFEFKDFELADRDKLAQEFKQHQELIYKYTR